MYFIYTITTKILKYIFMKILEKTTYVDHNI